MTLLHVRALSKSFTAGGQTHCVLDRVDLTVDEGEFVVLIGPSGAGKSTLLSLLAGLLKADAGSIELAGTPITGPGRDRGFVFQHESLLPWLTAFQNVALAVDAAFPTWTAAQRRERVEDTLKLVNLGHAQDKRPAQLSGGMRQRVAVARALAMDPKILLLDEPFSALDALTRATLQEELERIRQADRKTVLMVTNDLDEALLLADRIVPLSRSAHSGNRFASRWPIRGAGAHWRRIRRTRRCGIGSSMRSSRSRGAKPPPRRSASRCRRSFPITRSARRVPKPPPAARVRHRSRRRRVERILAIARPRQDVRHAERTAGHRQGRRSRGP
jgi:nitrate/nitrite transport system ATP-binding protein